MCRGSRFLPVHCSALSASSSWLFPAPTTSVPRLARAIVLALYPSAPAPHHHHHHHRHHHHDNVAHPGREHAGPPQRAPAPSSSPPRLCRLRTAAAETSRGRLDLTCAIQVSVSPRPAGFPGYDGHPKLQEVPGWQRNGQQDVLLLHGGSIWWAERNGRQGYCAEYVALAIHICVFHKRTSAVLLHM